MDTTRPPPPTAVTPKKPRPAKKQKKTTTKKKNKNQPAPSKALSPISKTDKSDEDPKQKLYNLYENYQNYDHKRADTEIRMAEQKQLEVLRDMLVKGFAVKNLQSLHKTLIQSSEKKKNTPGKINDRGDGFKFGSSEKTLAAPKIKAKVKTGSTVVKKAMPLKKPCVKKINSN